MDQREGVLGLETIRRNRGVSLEQIAQTTKISLRSLRAIELGEFEKLPGGIYNTSYIKQYARAIDFDETELLEYYHRHVGAGGAGSGGPLPSGKSSLFDGFRPASTIAGS